MSSVAGSVLVTGGAGYIGSHVVLALRDAGHDVVVIDNLSTGWAEAIPAGVPAYIGDIANSPLVERAIAENGVTSILHFAGSIVVPESVANPMAYYRNNTVGSWALIDAAMRMGIAEFVFSSTAAVYGHATYQIIPEDAPLAPINPYGWSKLMTERMLTDAAATSRLRFAILRYFNVAGADPAKRSGQHSKISTHLIKIACEAAVNKRPFVNVFGSDFPTPDGTAVRDYVHVSDLADAHVLALQTLRTGHATNWIANCGYGRGFSVRQVLDMVDAVLGRPLKRVAANRRPGDPASLIADSGKLIQMTGWSPRFADLEAIVRDALSWERHSISGGL